MQKTVMEMFYAIWKDYLENGESSKIPRYLAKNKVSAGGEKEIGEFTGSDVIYETEL